MEIITHINNQRTVAEIKGEGVYLGGVEDGVDMIGNMYYQGYDCIILYADNITPEFFDLHTKLAGEILQKFSNYRMRVAIIGDWKNTTSKSLPDFIRESNAGRQVYFTDRLENALEKLSQ